MSNRDMATVLDRLILRWEDEVTEFKEANDNFSTSDIGKYVSALSNEANLRNCDQAWLVFGVSNKSRAVVGTEYRENTERLQSLKMQIAENISPRLSVRDIHVISHPLGRVIAFEIPPAPLGLPIAWKGHYYARAGESLTSLSIDKLDQIRQQTMNLDWTAHMVADASLADLDERAVIHARTSFAQKHANVFAANEVAQWSTTAFLDRAKITHDGRITRAALLLLGKPESTRYLNPHPAQLTWKLVGPEQAYQHFGPPFLLTTTDVFQRIRNVQMRILPDDSFLTVEVSKYDQRIVLEALHNCIAHQDYGRHGRVVVTEKPDRLIFENEGSFFEGQPNDYMSGEKTPRRYRNPFLTQAMVELNMIDTMGYGIYAMHTGQAKRYFPMPDYDISNDSQVRLVIHGAVADPAYSRLLIKHTDLSLHEILALDRIQKSLPVPDVALRQLRRRGLVEGRRPHLHISAEVAQVTGDKAAYIRTRSQDDDFYCKLVMDYLAKFHQASRSELEDLLLDKLSEALDPQQRVKKISNLLTKMRRNRLISSNGPKKKALWRLQNNAE